MYIYFDNMKNKMCLCHGIVWWTKLPRDRQGRPSGHSFPSDFTGNVSDVSAGMQCRILPNFGTSASLFQAMNSNQIAEQPNHH